MTTASSTRSRTLAKQSGRFSSSFLPIMVTATRVLPATAGISTGGRIGTGTAVTIRGWSLRFTTGAKTTGADSDSARTGAGAVGTGATGRRNRTGVRVRSTRTRSSTAAAVRAQVKPS